MARISAIALVLVSTLSHASGHGSGHRRALRSNIPTRGNHHNSIMLNGVGVDISLASAQPAAETVQVPLDHFGGVEGNFSNRFWADDSYYQQGGPVFLWDIGEADASPYASYYLNHNTSFLKQIMQQFGAVGIVWEHRYYGNSTPVAINASTKPEEFQWLTTEQSLADVKTFADQFSRSRFPDVDLTPKKTPWVFVGGSYSGMRAAFMRKFYPDTIYASYASSAPVEASIDMSSYWEPIVTGMAASGFGNCSKDITASILAMDQLMDDPSQSAALKIKFLGKGADQNSNELFASALTSVFAFWQEYGMEGTGFGLRAFCDWLEHDPSSGYAGADGWAKSKGTDFTISRWATWPILKSLINGELNASCLGPRKRGIQVRDDGASNNCILDDMPTNPGAIGWAWQYCTQWGFFQSANLGPNQLVSKYYSLQYFHDRCHRMFPNASSTIFPDWPATNATNAHFGGWEIRPSNVYWSGGQFDPWRTLSPLSDIAGSPEPKLTQTPTACGVPSDEQDIFAYVIPFAEHCFDLDTTFAGGTPSRQNFIQALQGWLKCWKPSS